MKYLILLLFLTGCKTVNYEQYKCVDGVVWNYIGDGIYAKTVGKCFKEIPDENP